MPFRPFFSERFKNIRQSYFLGIRDISALLSVKSSGNITSWEQQKLIPSLDVLHKIIILFAVSSDWLLGYTDEPYNEKVISSIEHCILNKYNKDYWVLFCYQLNLPVALFNEYFNEEKRVENYSLPVRANIIFLFHIVMAFIDATNVDVSVDDMEYYKILKQPEVYDRKEKNKREYFALLNRLISEIKAEKPLYDLMGM